MPDREDDGDDDGLREAAAHRGLKLVKSRKRKPGVGDYGRYGLNDGSGRPLFGFGPDGLTALPDDIRAYLRKSEVSTWAQSADLTPDRATPPRTPPETAIAEDRQLAAGPSAARADREHRGKQTSQSARQGQRQEPASSAAKTKAVDPPAREPEAKIKPRPEPEPQPVLTVRGASKADLEEIRMLAGSDIPAPAFASRFKDLKRAGGKIMIADLGGVIGCVAWQVIFGLQAPTARLTLLIVAENHRRNGVGRALVDAARSALADQGCTTIEAMSDIEVRNVNGFFRALNFAQKSYRFIADTKPA